MRKHLFLSAAAALVVGGNALAAEVSYNYVQGGLAVSRLSGNGESDTGIGLGVKGEAEIWSFLYGSLDVGNVKYSPTDAVDLTFQPVSLGVGAHTALGSVDVFGGLSLERVKVKTDVDGFGSNSNSDSGLGLTVGARGMVAENIQWTGSLKYRDMDDLDSIITIDVGGHYYFKPNMAVGVNLTRNDYDNDLAETAVLFSFRYDFSSMR